jgi:hypothetical protein
MTFRDETAFPGNREILERELSRSVAQVLHLVPGRTNAGHRSLQEVGVDLILSVTYVRATRHHEAAFAAELANSDNRGTTPDGVPEDIAADYARAKAELKTLLRRDLPTANLTLGPW